MGGGARENKVSTFYLSFSTLRNPTQLNCKDFSMKLFLMFNISTHFKLFAKNKMRKREKLQRH